MNVEVLARAAALIRFRHPSDQAAALDWNGFLPGAIEGVMAAGSREALLSGLRAQFAAIAPSVEFSGRAVAMRGEPPRETGTQLARWRHVGLGPEPPYTSWREGRDPDLASLRVTTPIDLAKLARCKTVRLRATTQRTGDGGRATVYLEIDRSGRAVARAEHKVAADREAFAETVEMPVDAVGARIGIQIDGDASVQLATPSLGCAAGAGDADGTGEYLDVARAVWSSQGSQELYSRQVIPCDGTACLAVARMPPATAFDARRDMLDVDLGDGVWMHMPLAVWSDGTQTFPRGSTIAAMPPHAPLALATRLAAMVGAWDTLWLFYPYFQDLKIDWPRALHDSLPRAAAAQSTRELYVALSQLLVALHDNHARIDHSALPITGILPLALRRFGDHVVVTGALADYAKELPIGSEILAINDEPALRGYARFAAQVPVATSGWADSIIPYWMTLGREGAFASVRVQPRGGTPHDVVLPYVSRSQYDASIREPRPAFGAELAPRVYYVDLESIKLERWQALLPVLPQARAIVLDMRGYPTSAVFTILGHFIDHEIDSPHWQLPVLESGGYQPSQWMIRPVVPRLSAAVVVVLDGRAGSLAETFLQIVHDHHIAVLIGEPSAGTNGNINSVTLAGGFAMQFTGLRVPLADGTALQGRGIVPDHIVHPTLDGVAAGRDEVLEAAIALATRRAGP